MEREGRRSGDGGETEGVGERGMEGLWVECMERGAD